MRVVGNCEYGLLLYRDKLPKFNNNKKMIFNCMDWEKDKKAIYRKKIHTTQKPVNLLQKLISIFTDEDDIVIDPVAGSGSSLVATESLGRKAYGFEINKEFYKKATEWIDICSRQQNLFHFIKKQQKLKQIAIKSAQTKQHKQGQSL